MKKKISHPLASSLILDELFALTLYEEFERMTKGDLKKAMQELISVEKEHVVFWQEFSGLNTNELTAALKLKLWLCVGAAKLFGVTAIHMVIEAIEVHGVHKYLDLWKSNQDAPLGNAVKEILLDEFKHEDEIVASMAERKINPEKVRSLLFGLNDGLVEILGAVSGFFAAFAKAEMVLMASSTVAVAGAISMAAGAYVASSSEQEVRKIEEGKAHFLNKIKEGPRPKTHPFNSALITGISYFFGAMVPVVPVIFGARTMAVPLITAGGMIILVSLVLGFLSGMNVKKRMAVNLLVMALAVSVTYGIGTLAKSIWGINL
ncbi:MAG: VIT1/CCC1 transporter family protein [Elusimicrobia bacterium]|nr:VIT1/CCC1 transporter family protein [Elusimicrobiota bacterium]